MRDLFPWDPVRRRRRTAIPDLDSIINERLTPAAPLTRPGWRAWEKKTFNIHRGCLHWHWDGASPSGEDLAGTIRSIVQEAYPISWWRGFGFGVVLELATMPGELQSVHESIDITANRKGTWQWAIVAVADAKAAFGIHTWTKGYLTPVYNGILDSFRDRGYQVGSIKKEKGKILQLMLALPKLAGGGIVEFDPDE